MSLLVIDKFIIANERYSRLNLINLVKKKSLSSRRLLDHNFLYLVQLCDSQINFHTMTLEYIMLNKPSLPHRRRKWKLFATLHENGGDEYLAWPLPPTSKFRNLNNFLHGKLFSSRGAVENQFQEFANSRFPLF